MIQVRTSVVLLSKRVAACLANRPCTRTPQSRSGNGVEAISPICAWASCIADDVSKDEYYERLEDLRRKWEERQAKKLVEKSLQADASSNATATAGSSAPVLTVGQAATKPRKSKWDTSSSAEPPAKRIAE